MPTRTLAKAEWGPYFDRIASLLPGKRASVEILSEAIGDQRMADRRPLLGISYDGKDNLIEVAMEGLDHLVTDPRDLKIEERDGALASFEITTADGTRQIVILDDPIMLSGS